MRFTHDHEYEWRTIGYCASEWYQKTHIKSDSKGSIDITVKWGSLYYKKIKQQSMALVSFIYFVLAIIACSGFVIHTSAAGENFVCPSEFENQTCQFCPCLPLDDYANEADQYFEDNTIFTFLPGTHQLNILLDLKNKSNITFLVRDDDESRDNVSLVFSPSINITWTSCSDIKIRGLRIHLSGREISDDNNDYIFASLVYRNTSGSLSRLTILGSETSMFSTAIFLNDSSCIKISDVKIIGAKSIQGAGLHADNSRVDISSQNAFINNHATGEGGAMALYNCNCSIVGSILFINSTARDGGAMAFDSGNHNICGDISFISNSATSKGGALILRGGQYDISGRVSFLNNQAVLGGALSILSPFNSTHNNIEVSFIGNSATKGGAIYSANSGTHSISGNISFINNTAGIDVFGFGGAIAAYSSTVELDGKVLFEENTADSGGAIYMENGVASTSGTQQFIQNSAKRGGTMHFSGTSKLVLSSPLTADFTENQADYGGVIFVVDTNNYDNQCSNSQSGPTTLEECFFELKDYNASDIHLNFINNNASEAGKILYGGNIDKCQLLIKGDTMCNICERRHNADYDPHPLSKLESISNTISIDNSVSDISSDPLKICFCGENDTFQCTDQEIWAVRGKEFTLQAVTFGQNEGRIPSDVRIHLDNGIRINETQRVQKTTNECSPISFRLFSTNCTITVVLFPDNSPCRDTGISHRKIEVTFDPCPDAFDLQNDECACDKRLQKYTNDCSVDDNSIMRNSDTFWMGAEYDNFTFKGLILHDSGCPFDYCVDTPVSVTLDNIDIQCNHNHAGLLCGSCKDNYSIAFGTVHCLRCSNANLSLILLFALAGIVLVAVLLLLKLSVANGTINGLIFYANIVQANRSIFFPLGKTNPLTIFVAWLNLDLGIETCFYDGMNTYAFTWLQFVFPFYVWFLIGLIIVVTRYSQKATTMLGTNPVAALATLFLLSYSKLLRTVIMALSVTTLEYPGYINKKVWLYDGNVPYFGSPDHIALGLFAILVLVILFLPYTLLLLCGHWLQVFSHWRVLSWINKLKPFLDAYHASYKKETRYWTGLLLIVRCILLLVFGLKAFGNANTNLVVITTFTACLLALASLHKGIYKTAYNNILETIFILNLCVFSAATYHMKEIGGDQAALAYTSVGIAFSTFLLIVLCHIIYPALSKTSVGKKLLSLNFVARLIGADVNKLERQRAERDNGPNGGQGEQHNLANQAPTTSFIDIREYEPLLDSN